MLAIAIGVLVDPGEASRANAALPLLMAALFIPAAWASVARTERRRAVLRGSVLVSVVMAVAGSVLFGPLLLLLAPATTILWLAAGGPRQGR